MPEAQDLMPLLKEALAKYTDAPLDQLGPETRFADINIDSLTMAELLFELEDRLGTTLDNTEEIPSTVGEVLALIAQHSPKSAS